MFTFCRNPWVGQIYVLLKLAEVSEVGSGESFAVIDSLHALVTARDSTMILMILEISSSVAQVFLLEIPLCKNAFRFDLH